MLVFLPGIETISATRNLLENDEYLKTKVEVGELHGDLVGKDQNTALQAAAIGKLKVLLLGGSRELHRLR